MVSSRQAASGRRNGNGGGNGGRGASGRGKSKGSGGRGAGGRMAQATASAGASGAGAGACPEMRMLRLAQIDKPKYDFTIKRQSAVAHLCERLEAGSPIPHVLVAQMGDRYYPFASFASLEAYRTLAMDVPCQVHQASSARDILELHISRAQKEVVHPIRYIEGVSELLHDGGADPAIVPEEYRSFGTRPILLTSGAREMLDKFLVEVGEKYGIVGEWTHVIEAISRLKDDAQDRAVSEIVSYVKTQRRPVPPDLYSLRKIVDAYGTDKLQKMYAPDEDDEDEDEDDDGVGAYGGASSGSGASGGKKKGKGAGGKGGGGASSGAADLDKAESVIVSSGSKGEMPLVMSPVPSTLKHGCECGQEFMVNMKNATVRRLTPKEEGVLVLEGDEGRPIFAIPQAGVDFLDMQIQSASLRFYYVGVETSDDEDGDRGHTMIITKRHISKANQAAIRRIIEGKNGGGGSGNRSGGGGGAGR